MDEFKVGDWVEIVKGKERHTVQVTERNEGEPGLTTNGYWLALFVYPREGWSVSLVERAQPELPTEPGFYVETNKDGLNHLWKLSSHGRWLSAADPKYDDRVSDFLPLTRLEPVSDTVKRAREVIKERIDEPAQGDAHFINVGLKIALSAIKAEFGAAS